MRSARSRTVVLAVALGLLLAASARGVNPVTSTFDAGADRWTVVGDPVGGETPTHIAAGGNPGGFIRVEDGGTGAFMYWNAPAKFLGDRRAYYGGTLGFDLAQSAVDGQADEPDVILEGGGQTLSFDTPANPGTTWTAYSVPLNEGGGWVNDGTSPARAPTRAEFLATLGALSSLRIRAEYRFGPDTDDLDNVVMEAASAPPPPALGKTVTVDVVKGEVFIKLPAGTSARASQKGSGFEPLTEARTVPVRSILDTRKGTIALRAARNRRGRLQSGRFSAGVFQILQSRKRRAKGLTTLKLRGSRAAFRRCDGDKRTATAEASRLSRRAIRRLRGRARGRYRTRGRRSAATVRGTVWNMTDSCAGTLTRVKRGKVAVRDFRRKKTIILTRGKRYLARAPGS